MATCCGTTVTLVTVSDAANCAELRFACDGAFNPSRPGNSNQFRFPRAIYSATEQRDNDGTVITWNIGIDRAYNYPHDNRSALAQPFAYDCDFYVYGIAARTAVYDVYNNPPDFTITFDANGDGGVEWLWKNLSQATHGVTVSDDPIDLVGPPVGSTGLSLPDQCTMPSSGANQTTGNYQGWIGDYIIAVAKPVFDFV